MKHPEELLASYVDGTLEARERAEVDAHLRECETCREEVDLAGRGRAALVSLPELDVPPETIRPSLERTAPRWRRDRFRRTAWATGIAAAAGIAAILALVLVSNPTGNRAISTAGGGASKAPTQVKPPFGPAVIVHSDRNYDASSIDALAGSLARRVADSTTLSGGEAVTTAGGAGAAGAQAPSPSPAPATAKNSEKYAGIRTSTPQTCVRLGASTLNPNRLLRVIEARYQGSPAYIGVFLRDGELPDAVVVAVVARSDCALVTSVEQQLP